MDPNTDPRALAEQNSFWQALKARLVPQGLLGQGMVQSASQSLQSRPYMLHVQEARAMGQEPMTPEQFQQSQRRGLLGS
jgi:hypothetical protein